MPSWGTTGYELRSQSSVTVSNRKPLPGGPTEATGVKGCHQGRLARKQELFNILRSDSFAQLAPRSAVLRHGRNRRQILVDQCRSFATAALLDHEQGPPIEPIWVSSCADGDVHYAGHVDLDHVGTCDPSQRPSQRRFSALTPGESGREILSPSTDASPASVSRSRNADGKKG